MLLIAIAVTPSFGQSGRGGRGMMGDSANAADMQLFHQLFEHRMEIDRQVLKRQDGIETVTESKNPEVTRLLQAHAEVIGACLANGMPEMMKNHAVPPR